MLGGEKGPQVIAQLERFGYVDLYRRFGRPSQTTFPAAAIPIRIDFILASSSLAPRVTDCQIYPNAGTVSDHYPVVAEIGD